MSEVAPEAKPAVMTQGLTRMYGDMIALSNLDLTVNRGDLFGFIGSNGAGKTTTLRILATFLAPSSGNAWVLGNDVVSNADAVRHGIGYMPDFFGVYKDMEVTEYLDFFGACYKIPSAQRERTVKDVLELVGLSEKRGALIGALSRGMQQRLGLARVLVHDPELLLLDEPASGLDPRARIEFRDLILELRRLGKTVFLSSHILSELSPICDSVSIIEKGRVVAHGSIDEIQTLMSQGKTSFDVTLLKDPGNELEPLLSQLPGFMLVMIQGKKFRFEWTGDVEEVSKVWELLSTNGFVISGISKKEDNLENIFMSLTTGEVQ